MTTYFVLKPDGYFAMYGNLTLLCEREELGYSKLSKLFLNKNYHEDQSVKIYKGQRKTRG